MTWISFGVVMVFLGIFCILVFVILPLIQKAYDRRQWQRASEQIYMTRCRCCGVAMQYPKPGVCENCRHARGRLTDRGFMYDRVGVACKRCGLMLELEIDDQFRATPESIAHTFLSPRCDVCYTVGAPLYHWKRPKHQEEKATS